MDRTIVEKNVRMVSADQCRRLKQNFEQVTEEPVLTLFFVPYCAYHVLMYIPDTAAKSEGDQPNSSFSSNSSSLAR
jgi:hypothetical protein